MNEERKVTGWQDGRILGTEHVGEPSEPCLSHGQPAAPPPALGWAIVDLVGQRRVGGRVSEVTVAGVAFIRVQVPHPNDSSLVRITRFFNPSAVRAITPTSEEVASNIARGGPGPRKRKGPDGSIATHDAEAAMWEASRARNAVEGDERDAR